MRQAGMKDIAKWEADKYFCRCGYITLKQTVMLDIAI